MPGPLDRHTLPVLQALRSSPKSRLELVGATGWSTNTVAKRLDELMAADWIREATPDSLGRGRPFAQYQVNPNAAAVYAGVFSWRQLSGALCGLDGSPLATEVLPLDLYETEDTVSVLLSQLERLSAQLPVGNTKVLAGTISGPSSTANRITTGAWAQTPRLADELPRKLGIPFLVENDANAMALGLRPKYPGVQSYIFVKVGTGIGAGIMAGGQILRGVDGLAGEIGHIPIPRAADQPCGCGNRGCVALIANSRAVMDSLSTPASPLVDLDDLLRRVATGDERAVAALRAAGRDLGEALVGVITAIAPELLVLGGRITQFGDHLATGVRESITQKTLPAISSRVRVETIQDHHAAGIRGGAELAFDTLLG